ncbi:MAG: hypothetical protein HYY65_14155 [Candidatus Tectomicrobia bacterium]|uniref:Uncharacterized protein n=1 Tax=Tectimicrobiota bacterium TaxID=2528274 RepID=A0A932GS84_UNCTE|nr:hypothetical protein [Candidatus Tectomicrobia bacterium]
MSVKSSRRRYRINYWLFFPVLGALLLAAIPPQAEAGPKQLPLPTTLGEMRLDHSLQGQEALKDIFRLHGKTFDLKDGYVGHYSNKAAKAMVWVSESKNQDQSRQLLQMMAAEIRRGRGPYSNFQEFDVNGKVVYSVDGQGQQHYFYGSGKRNVWLAVDPPAAQKALHELLMKIKPFEVTKP